MDIYLSIYIAIHSFSRKKIQRNFLSANLQNGQPFGKHVWRITAMRLTVICYKFNKLLRVKFFRLPDTFEEVCHSTFLYHAVDANDNLWLADG